MDKICEGLHYIFSHKDAYEIKSKYLDWESINRLYRELYEMRSSGGRKEVLKLSLEHQKTLQNLARNIVFAWVFVLSSPIKIVDKKDLEAKKYLKKVLKSSNYLFNQSDTKKSKEKKKKDVKVEEKKAA